LRKNPFWKSLYLYSIVSSIAALLLMISSFWMADDFKLFGLFERILVAIEIVWVIIMAVWLLRISLKNTHTFITSK